MTEENYGMTVTTAMGVEDAEAAIRQALADEGFGILTEIDLAATFKEKLGIDRPAYKILGACSPPLAHRAVGIDPRAGLLLPCNVIVAADGDQTVISIVDPDVMMNITDADGPLSEVATEARKRLTKALIAVA